MLSIKRYIKKFKRNTENITGIMKTIFTIWIILFVCSGIAFAGFTTTLTVDSSATIQKHIYDYVYLSHVEVSDSSGGSSLYYSFTDHELKSTNITQSCNNYVTYALTIVNTTPYKAYITNSTLNSMINGNGNTTSSESYEFTDVTLNSTYVEPHSTKIVHLKIYSNCTTTDSQVTSTIDFEYSLYKYFDLTVISDQSDSTVTMTTSEGTFTGTGDVMNRVYEGDTATYTVSKHHYYDSTGSYKMGTEDHTINVTMTPDPRRDVTFGVTNKINVPPTTYTVKDSSGNTIEPQSGSTYILNKGETYTYTIKNVEYYDYSGSYTVTDSDGQTVNATMTERPWITGTTSNSDRTTAATYSDTNYHPGYYLIELWGGTGADGGGNNGGDAGTAGTVYGVVYIGNTTVYATAGGNGYKDGSYQAGGANGGGSSGGDDTNRTGGSGGGYSAFAVGTTTMSIDYCASGSIKFVAAGSAGGGGAGGQLGTFSGGEGGDGGNLSSTSTAVTGGTVYHGTDGTVDSSVLSIYQQGEGGGGTSTAGAAGTGTTSTGNTSSASPGEAFKGGNAQGRGGGGGAGYYGGGGGAGYRTPASGSDFGPGGGGGGSSFVASGISTSYPSGFSANSNPSSTGGAVIIRWYGYNAP